MMKLYIALISCIAILCAWALRADAALSEGAFYNRLRAEINAATSARDRNAMAREMDPRNFMSADLDRIAYLRNRPRLLASLKQVQERNRPEYAQITASTAGRGGQARSGKTMANRGEATEPAQSPSSLELNSFVWRLPSLSARAGMDYFYIDPGYLLPEDRQVQIKSHPFYYYDIKAGIRFNFIGFDARLKNSILDLGGDNLNENYVNREDITSKEEEAKTRERVLNLVGFFTPFRIRTGERYSVGLYANGEYRLFQTEVDVEIPTTFRDRSTTVTLNPGETNLVNMFTQAYTIGLVFSREAYKIAFGYRYIQIDAPHFVKDANAVETITSKTHSVYVYNESKRGNYRFTCEGTYGLSRFNRPDGTAVEHIYEYEETSTGYEPRSTRRFYRSQVRNTYGVVMWGHVTFGLYLGYSGYVPVYDQTMPAIAVSLAAQAYSFYKSHSYGFVSVLQAPAEILTSYYLVKKMQGDVFYSEIMAGLQAGISI